MKKNSAVSYSTPGGSDEPLTSVSKINPEAKQLPVEGWLLRRALNLLGRPGISIILWTGETVSLPNVRTVNRLYINDRGALYKLLSNPRVYFGDLYSEGRIEVEGNLVELLTNFNQAADRTKENDSILRKQIRNVLVRYPRENSVAGSHENISHHYNIGNNFYKLWLDKQHMQYTCAYYPSANITLEQAQTAKLEHICRKLSLEPGETVIEAGCGWGGLARYMAKHYGVKVRSYNISHPQILYARQKAEEEGLSDLVKYVEDDYRNISGKCDVFVSVGMLEHVGYDNYKQLGNVINRCLKQEGRGLIHSIGRNQPALLNAWIEKRIFPGAYPPALKEMIDIFEPHKLSVLDVENMRLHYALTLEDWLKRYEQHADEVKDMFDQKFFRAWQFYLAGSIAAFMSGNLQLFQLLFTRHNNNNLFLTREHIYRNHADKTM